MAEGETVSISKGCFLFNPKGTSGQPSKVKSRRRRSLRKATRYFTGDKFPLLKGETDKHATLRYACFKECCTRISGQIESIQLAINKKVFDDLLSYVKDGHSEKTTKFPRREIPTAALLTGVNMPDHDIIFEQITSDILRNVTSHVVLLHSKDCSNIRFLTKEVITQLMVNEEDNAEEDGDLDKSFFEDMGKIKSFTFKVLKTWYLRMTQSSSEKLPIVIILEDFEGFPKAVLQDFILILSEYIDELPIVLVLSLATTINAVHHALPHSVSTRLSIEKFQAKPSLECLHEILNKVFLTSRHPFKLGPDVLGVFYDKFLYQDFSIQSFTSAVQFAILEHFYNNPLSVLCGYEEDTYEAAIDDLIGNQMEVIINMPSFQRFRDRKSLQDQARLEEDVPFIKKCTKKMIKDIRHVLSTLYPLLKCLHKLTSKLPGSPFGKRLKDAYEYCMKQELVKTEKYQTSIALLRQTSKEDLLLLMQDCCSILENSIKEDAKCACFRHDLAKLGELTKKFDALDELRMHNIEETTTASKTPAKMPVYKNRFEFQERMRQAVKEKKATPYDNLRNEIIDCWDAMFKKYLRCPVLLPLNEIFFFDDKDAVIPHINPTPRLSVQNALRDPHHYLQCECCKMDLDDNQETLPDISIVYKIHLECGRMINLYDWLQAFVAIVDPSPASKKNSKKRRAEDECLQARFVQSVSEMQLLGLIKPTKRKTDHVQRLTWGF